MEAALMRENPMQMTEDFGKLIIRICRSVNPKTVEEYA